MPLIIICGTPVSGKSTRAYELKDFFEKKHGKVVEIVSEAEAISKLGYEKNSTYLDSQKEKRVRGYLKSDVIRLLGKDNVVILDGSNYIKGFRYELYCASKASKSTQCTVFTIRNYKEAAEANKHRMQDKDGDADNRNPDKEKNIKESRLNTEPYTEEVFNALTMLRFEEPICNNRWDSPLFTVQPQTPLDLEEVYSVLFEKKPPPPNMSTQNPPLSSTNFLYELDKVTQSVSKQILEAKQLNLDEVKFPEYPGCVLEAGFLQAANPQKLLRLRRQFLTYAKMNHSNEDANKIGRYFVQYLNKTLVDYSCFLLVGYKQLPAHYWAWARAWGNDTREVRSLLHHAAPMRTNDEISESGNGLDETYRLYQLLASLALMWILLISHHNPYCPTAGLLSE